MINRGAPRKAGQARVELRHGQGDTHHSFDLVICSRCGRTDFYVDQEPRAWVERRATSHPFIEYTLPEPAPYRG